MLELIFAVAGFIWCAAGVAVFSAAKSVMHEILGAVLVSFGFLFFAVAGIAARISDKSAALIAVAKEAASRSDKVSGPLQ